MSPVAVYSPTAAAAAAGINGYSVYTLPQPVPFNQGRRSSQDFHYGTIWQQQNYVYGQPMRAYR